MSSETPEQQPRIPGVKYRQVKKIRLVTTKIDGRESIHEEEFFVEEPVPPRDWEAVVLRGVIGLALFLTLVAFVGTSAAAGGLFSELLHPAVAYPLGLVFTASWLGCLGLEWLDGRIDPDRAKPARTAGWTALIIGMGAVFIYGASKDLPWVGAAGSCIDLLAKGFWTLLLRRYQVRLSKGVANWVVQEEQRAAGVALLAERLRRLYRGEAYRSAVGGREYEAAQALTTAPVEGAALTASGQTEQRPDVSTPTTGQTPTEPAPEPVPPAPTAPPAPASGQPSGTVSAQAAPPASPATGQGGNVSGQGPDSAPDKGADTSDDGGTEDVVRQIASPSIAATIRSVLKYDPRVSDADLTAQVAAVHGYRDKLPETVRRSRDRIENPKPKKRKSAS